MAEIENKWALRESGKNCVDRTVQRRSAGKQGQRIEIALNRPLLRGRLDAAIEQFKRAISSGYPTYFAYTFLAGAEAAKMNDAEAKLALAEARRLNPQLTIKWLTTETATPSIVIDGLRKAGLPEE